MATGVPDVITAANFFKTIYSNLHGADKDFEGFASTAKELSTLLEALSQTLEGQKRKIEARGGTYEGDEYIWSTPGQILDGWKVLRDQTDDFMNKHKLYQQNKATAKIKQILWKGSGDMSAEINRLTKWLSFYTQKVQLVATTLHNKFQSDMSDRHDERHQELASKLDILLARSGGAAHTESESSSADALRAASSQWLDEKIARKFKHDFGDSHESPAFLELVDSSVWWLVQGKTCAPDEIFSITDAEACMRKFVHFSKAQWVLQKVVALEEYRQLKESSIWCQYIGELSEDVSRELEQFQEDSFIMPSMEALQQLEHDEPDIFDININWSLGKFQSQHSLVNAPKIKILELSLPGYPAREVDRTMIIYQNDDEDEYSCEVITALKKHSSLNLLANVPFPYLDRFNISLRKGQIIPTYIYGTKQESTTLHLRASEGNKQDGFDFNNLKDMFALQKTLTGHSVQADFAKVSAVKFRLSGIIPKTVEYQDVRVQIWLEVLPKSRRSSASTFASASTSKSDQSPTPHTGNTRTVSFASEKFMPVQMLSGVEVAHIFVFGKTESPGKTESNQVLWIIRIDHSTELDETKCCVKSRTDPEGNQLVQCCERMVIKGKITAIKFTQEDPKKPLGIPLDRRFLHYFSTKIDSVVQENLQIPWLAFDFASQRHKQQFMSKFNQLHALSVTKLVEQHKEQARYRDV